MVGFKKMFIFQLFLFLLCFWYTQTVSAIDLTTNNATGTGNMTIARYMVNLGFSGGQSVNNATQESGLYDYARSHGNQSPWYVINDGSASSIAVTYWDCGQWGSTCTPTPDYFGYKFKYPAEVTKITFTDHSFNDGGTFSSTPALQYLPFPGGSWTTVSAAWNIPYVSSFAGGRSNTYIITPDIPIKGAWGLRLHGNAAPAPGAMDQSGWVSVREFKVEGQPDFGRSIIFANNLAAGATPVCSNSAWQSGSGNEMLDGNFDNNTQVWDLNQPSGDKYVGVTWDSPKNNVTALGFGMTFNSTGGWFVDTQENPLRVQYTLDGSTWIDVSGLNKGRYTDDYSAAAALGNTYKGSWLFTFNPVSGIRGLRLLGLPGGSGLNGFGYVSIREFEVFSSCLEPPSGLVSWWGGDNNALDMVGGNHGLLNGATFTVGQVGQAFSFDGVNDYVSVSDSPSLQAITNQFSIEAWVRPSSLPSGDPYYDAAIIEREDYVQGFALATRGNAFGLWIGNGSVPGVMAISNTVSIDNWYHVVGTYDGSNARIYVNGNLENTQPVTIVNRNQALSIGSSRGGSRFFTGLIDEAAIYNRVLSSEEIVATYNAGSSGKCRSCAPPPLEMVSWWRGENNALDLVGTNDGTLQDGVTYAAGKVGQAFSFTVDGAMVTIPHHTALLLDSNPAATFDGWFRSTGGDSMVIGKHSAGIGWFFTTGQGCYFGDHHIGGLGVGGLNLNDGLFHHFACVKDGTTYREYIDGVLLAEDTGPNTGTPDYGSVEIGRYEFGAQLTGIVDELEVFHRALSTAEIQAIYNAGSAGKCAPDLAPDSFTFLDQTGVDPNGLVESNAQTVSGIDYAAPIRVTGGSYKVSTDGGTTFSDCSPTTPATVSLNDQVKVCLTASPNFLTSTSATLTIGTISGTFTVITRAQSADLSITKTSAPEAPVVGQPLTYTLTVTNSGPDTAEGVTVTDTLAAGLSFSSASVGCQENSGTVTCNLGSIANGAQKSVEIVVIPAVPGPVSNTAGVSSSVGDPDTTDNTSVPDQTTVYAQLYLPLILRN